MKRGRENPLVEMKRGSENEERASFGSFDVTKCLMLLFQSLETKPKPDHLVEDVYECKTCHRIFPSFQALGGHRASHKRPRLKEDQIKANGSTFLSLAITKPKMHHCTICGKEFRMGQALGGHMRKHRASIYESFTPFPVVSQGVQMLSRSNGKRILCLDLNLTPSENDSEALLGKTMAPN